MNLPQRRSYLQCLNREEKGESTLFFVEKRTEKQCHSFNFQVLKINSTYVIYYKGRY